MAEKAKPKRKLTDEENFRGDKLQEAERKAAEYEEEQRKLKESEEGSKPTNFNKHGRNGQMGDIIDPSEWDMDDIKDSYALDENTEVKVRIYKVEKSVVQKTGQLILRVICEVPDQPFVKPIRGSMFMPHRESQDDREFNEAKKRLLYFGECFGTDVKRRFNPEEAWVGLEGWVMVKKTSSDEYGEQNEIKRMIKPRN